MKKEMLEKFVLSTIIGFSAFSVATALGDWLVGPLIVKLFDYQGLVRAFHFSRAIPYMVQNGCMFLIFGAISRVSRMKRKEERLMFWALVNPVSFLISGSLYFFLLTGRVTAPVLYSSVADDISDGVWFMTIAPSAVFPVAAYLATIGIWIHRKKRVRDKNVLDQGGPASASLR